MSSRSAAQAGQGRVPARPALRVLEHHLMVYRRTWRGTLFLTFLTPVLFLAAMGLGLGGYVNEAQPGGIGGVPYLAFLAPGLLAAQAMQTAAFESTYPVMGALVWQRLYDGMLATPLRTADVVLGHLGWVGLRLLLVASVFLAVMAAFGAVASPLAVLAVPAAALTGLAFAAPITAFAATQRNDTAFNAIFRFGVTPLFLFSGTFFPISQLPDLVEPIAWVTPLYHGIELTRSLALGAFEPVGAAVHVGVLLAFAIGGGVVCLVTFRRRLRK